jgi:hypothetical protein
VIGLSLAYSTAIMLRVEELAAAHADAVVSSNTLMLPGYQDIVCWNGSASASCPDVVWVWEFTPVGDEHGGHDRLHRALAAMRSELGVEAVPGTGFTARRTSPDLADDHRWVSVTSSVLYPGVEVVDGDLHEQRQPCERPEPEAALFRSRRLASDKNVQADRYLAERFPHAYPRTPPRLVDNGGAPGRSADGGRRQVRRPRVA